MIITSTNPVVNIGEVRSTLKASPISTTGKARQSAITQEISEISAGMASVS